MTKRKEKIEKPKGFKLSSYEEIKNLTPTGWYYELLFRKIAYDALCNDDQDKFWTYINEIRIGAYPLIEKGNLQNKEASFEPDNWIKKGLKTNALRLTTLGDIDSINFETSTNNGSPKKTNLIQNIIESYTPIDIAFLESNGTPPTHINITINLAASNSTLKEDFEKIINATRKYLAIETKKEASVSKIKTWEKHRVLQHIDLQIWSIYEGLNIKPKQLVDWIHPENYPPRSNAERSRDAKLGHQKALQLLDFEFLNNFKAELLSGTFADEIKNKERELKINTP